MPTITSFSPSTGAPGTLITIAGANLGTPTAFTIGGYNALVVSNSGTQLIGLVMPGCLTGVVSLTTSGGTAISGSNFTMASTPYPNLQQGSKLIAIGGATGGTGIPPHGSSVSISSDGNTAIVGGESDTSYVAGYVGAASIYTRSGGVWTQQGSKLVGTGAVGNAQQGVSVAISADGNTAIVGGPYDNGNLGAAWVFTRSGGVWTQEGSKLIGTGAVSATLGTSVAISADGNTAIVGGPYDNGNLGAAWVFTRTGGVWTQQGSKLVDTGAGVAYQGISVSISSDGNTAIVGGNASGSVGTAWIYIRSGGVWTQQGGILFPTGAIGSFQIGCSVSISSDGNTAIVGGRGDNNGEGAAWIYTRFGGVWTQQGSKLVGTGAIGSAYQGHSVSISADGNIAIVGGSADNNYSGATWIYSRSGGVWIQKGSKLVGTGAVGSVGQGSSVSISSDGSTALVGGPFDNNWEGAAWVFVVNQIAVGVDNAINNNNQLSIYPNPNNGVFTVSLNKTEGYSKSGSVYSIVNTLGQTVQSFKLNAINNYTMNIENLKNGIYFIVGFNNNQMTGQKVVVAK